MPENNNELAICSRSSILGQLGKELLHSKKDKASSGLLVLRVLSLHDINTIYGYENGNDFIFRLFQLTQKILSKEDIVFRVGNDEFAILLKSILNKNHIILAINKILTNLTKPFLIKDEQVQVQISIGAAFFPDDADDAERLLIYADMALAKAIKDGKAYNFFSEQNVFKGFSNLVIRKELDKAIDNFELTLLYQPKIDLQKNEICGAECLMRWNNSMMGTVPPDVFITVAESTGQIMDLTIWSLNVALRQAQKWCSKWPGFQIAINLSAAILYDPNIIQIIKNALNMWSIEPDNVMFEVTESAVMLEPEHSLEVLKNLTELGLDLSIDDFGTGYSSLAYLKHLPVAELKIDKSFVLAMSQNEDDKIIARTIIELGHNFNLSVIAEGIEDKETMTELASLGCDKGQGYYMSRPVTESELYEFIQSSEWKLKPDDTGDSAIG